ncbi:retron St85 family effector protein [Sphingomonas carotinifaciens]|uniref:retron St85 family effector protein n=1 Tax=Sphingomonas carotinifaciens TaxID=1166323 RepID=UPI0039A0201D
MHAPTTIVFLCGGAIDEKLSVPITLRDAFYRITNKISPKYKIVLAEDAEPLTSEAGYHDLFSFESDIAQLVGLILLFAESAGSLAELGAFAALRTVSPSILAVLDDFYYSQVSFIRNGPVRYLENAHGEEWITVLDRKDVGISATGSIENLIPSAFAGSILPVIEKRLAANPKWSKFDRHNAGHAILLMTGLCQEYGALTQSEIRSYLTAFGVDEPRLPNFTYTAELLGWLKKVRKGNHIFYVATCDEAALDYTFESSAKQAEKPHDKVRWRADVRNFWRNNDPSRLRAIADARTPASVAQ